MSKASKKSNYKEKIGGLNSNAATLFMDSFEKQQQEYQEQLKNNQQEENEEAKKEAPTKTVSSKKKKTQPRKTPKKEETVKTFVQANDDIWSEIQQGDELADIKAQRQPTTFNLDPDLHEVIEPISKKMGKGYKSKILNEAIRYALTEKGLLK